MKIITLYGNNPSTSLTIVDEDEMPLPQYSEKLSRILKSSNVVILETSSGCTVIKPSSLLMIDVREESESLEVSSFRDSDLPPTDDVDDDPQEEIVIEEET